MSVETMQAIIAKPGEALSLETFDKPEPGPGQVRIKVAAAGLNRADILQRAGKYPPPPGAPDIMGLEVSGWIDAIGEGVTVWSLGQPVCALLPAGGYAEYAIAHAGSTLPVPDGVSMVEAAVLPEAIMTVWANVFDLGRLQAGETFLVQGGASGIGTTAIQMARNAGARVFATAGQDEKCSACETLGAEAAFNYRTQDFEAEMTAQGGADVVLDIVAGEYVAKHVNLLKPKGRLVHIAIQGGMKAQVNVLMIMMKQLVVTGSTLRGRSDDEKERIASAVRAHVWPDIEAGRFKPVIDSQFALADAEKAHERLNSGDHFGKIVLVVGDGQDALA